MYIYIYIYMVTHIRISIYSHKYIHIWIYLYLCMYIYIHIFVWMYIYTYINMFIYIQIYIYIGRQERAFGEEWRQPREVEQIVARGHAIETEFHAIRGRCFGEFPYFKVDLHLSSYACISADMWLWVGVPWASFTLLVTLPDENPLSQPTLSLSPQDRTHAVIGEPRFEVGDLAYDGGGVRWIRPRGIPRGTRPNLHHIRP